MVEKTYARLYLEGKVRRDGLFEERLKMAMLPQGAEPLPNPVGAAPGSWLELKDAVFLSLPGVPAELKGIFEGTARERLLALVREKGGRVVLTQELPSGVEDESVLCRITRRVMDEIEGIYLKTLPTGFSSDTDIAVRITAFGKDEDEAKERLEAGREALKKALEG
jgi:nicotinamide-nucleotide amidase